MQVLSTKNLKWLGLAGSGFVFFYGVGPSVASVTLDLPVKKVEPLSGHCVAYLIKDNLIRCSDKNKPKKYRNEVTFPRATYEQLKQIQNNL